MNETAGRVFLFLQGPHGPFFRRLAIRLASQGALVLRVAFNPGDEAEWGGPEWSRAEWAGAELGRSAPLDQFIGPISAYPAWLARYLALHGVTDIVLYGDSRPEHAVAVETARAYGILCHCLEEGYLRPHCVTYERWGNNGNSPLRGISLAQMARAIGPAAPPPEGLHDGWGAHRPHLWHSALYHAHLLLPSRLYGRHRSRRDLTLWREVGHLWMPPVMQGVFERLVHVIGCCHLSGLVVRFIRFRGPVWRYAVQRQITITGSASPMSTAGFTEPDLADHLPLLFADLLTSPTYR